MRRGAILVYGSNALCSQNMHMQNSEGKLNSRQDGFLLTILLLNLAVAQPLYDLLAGHAEFFVTYGFGPRGLLLFCFAVSLAAPAALALVPSMLRKPLPATGRLLELSLQFVAWVLIFLPVTSRAGLAGAVSISVAVLAAALVLIGYLKFYPVRLTLRYLTPAVLLFPIFFLADSRIASLMSTGEETDPVATGQAAPETDIVFLMFDEFPLASLLKPDLEINRERFPNFARLADRSAWFRSATTTSEITTHAVPTALTGQDRVDEFDKLPISANFPRNLFTLLAGSHDIISQETSTLLCPKSVCRDNVFEPDRSEMVKAFASDLFIIYGHIVTPPPWSQRLPSITHAWSGFARKTDEEARRDHGTNLHSDEILQRIKQQERWGDRAEDFEAFIGAIEPSARPRLYYHHALLPHSAWRFLPDGRQYVTDENRVNFGLLAEDDPNRVYFHEWYPDAHMVNQAWQRHLLQVGFVDTLLGRVLDRLEETGRLDDALVVIVGDHGASFRPGNSRRSVNVETQSDIAAVPLIIKFPGQQSGYIDDRPASLPDIMPTLVSALGIDPGWTFSGDDLKGKPRDRDEPVRIRDSSGNPHEFDRAGFRSHLRATVTRQARIFGVERGLRVFHMGPHPELVGQATEELDVTGSANGLLRLDNTTLFQRLNTSANFIPLQLWGHWFGSPADGTALPLAISVNGTVRATTQTYEIAKFAGTFSVVLPPDSFNDGDNDIRVFLIRDQGDSVTLERIPQDGPELPVLEPEDAGYAVVMPSGKRFELAGEPWPGIAETYLDRSSNLIYLQGSVETIPGRILSLNTFRDGLGIRSRALEPPWGASGDSAPARQEFRIPFVFADEERAARTEIRVLVLDETAGTAHELRYPPLCSPRWRFAPPAAWHIEDCSRLPSLLPPKTGRAYHAVLDFGDPRIRSHLDEGWHIDETGIAWTTKLEAAITLPLPGNKDEWRFTARIKPYLAPGRIDDQRLVIRTGDEVLGEWLLAESKFTDVEWRWTPSEATEQDELTLTFLLPNAVSPFSIGAGADRRKLGVAIHRLTIE
jgi:hypothetical protein